MDQIPRLHVHWDDAGAMQHIEVDVPVRAADPAPTGRVGLFFSGGVDSFYSLYTRRQEVTDLVIINGFARRDRTSWAQIREMATTVARKEDKNLIEVDTDARAALSSVPWLRQGHGALLASVGLLLQHVLDRIYIASSRGPRTLTASGTHPALDPLWSTERITFLHDALVPRLDKIRALAEYPLSMRWLRVCGHRPDHYNCGRCEKCLRTLIALRLVGA